MALIVEAGSIGDLGDRPAPEQKVLCPVQTHVYLVGVGRDADLLLEDPAEVVRTEMGDPR